MIIGQYQKHITGNQNAIDIILMRKKLVHHIHDFCYQEIIIVIEYLLFNTKSAIS